MTGATLLGGLALANVLLLLVTSALLVYPVVRYSPNVAHTVGFVSLAVAFFGLTMAAVDAFVFGPSVRTYLLGLGASLAALAGTAEFARPFLGFDEGDAALEDDRFAADAVADPPAFEGEFGGERG